MVDTGRVENTCYVAIERNVFVVAKRVAEQRGIQAAGGGTGHETRLHQGLGSQTSWSVG